MCAAGSRIFVHEKVYDKFLKDFTERTKQLKVGDPWEPGVYHGPQISQTQCDVRSLHVISILRFAHGYADVIAHHGIY